MKIDLPLAMPWNAWLVVKAEIVDVAPHISCATFAVHNEPGEVDEWSVSNIETGMSVVERFPSKERAIKAAKSKLASISNSYITYRMQIRNKETKSFGYSGDCK